MSFDALTYAGLLSAAVSGGFLIALATRTGVSQIRGRKPTTHKYQYIAPGHAPATDFWAASQLGRYGRDTPYRPGPFFASGSGLESLAGPAC
jgi:hypothetical protein